MNEVSILFPHQLFENNPCIGKHRRIFLIEESLFFNQYIFHKQKLVFHRASMKAYAAFLEKQGYAISYVEAKQNNSDIRELLQSLAKQHVTDIHYTDVIDYWLEQRIATHGHRLNLSLIRYETPLFLSAKSEIATYFRGKKKFLQTDFYTRQRKQFNFLLDEQLQPEGGKWTYDAENRLKYPKGKTPPQVQHPQANEFWIEAVRYVEQNFSSNYGRTGDHFVYPITFEQSRAWLTNFLGTRFREFGNFEDAIVAEEHILHHGLLTPCMNVGLLTPGEILDTTIAFSRGNEIPLNSLEGFVRQILGWREFVRGVYEEKGVTERTTNFWNFQRKIPKSFWNASTGISPIDNTIKKILDTGYCHHIERLMVLGNFMLLCEFDPDEVYRWFMELFIDSYDWVMVPNVYGMSQFADGGLMASKPYISGSNYLMKMSNFRKGEWQLVWDSLFWRFLHTHRDFFLSNPRLGMLVKTFDKMPDKKQREHISRANDYLKTLDAAT